MTLISVFIPNPIIFVDKLIEYPYDGYSEFLQIYSELRDILNSLCIYICKDPIKRKAIVNKFLALGDDKHTYYDFLYLNYKNEFIDLVIEHKNNFTEFQQICVKTVLDMYKIKLKEYTDITSDKNIDVEDEDLTNHFDINILINPSIIENKEYYVEYLKWLIELSSLMQINIRPKYNVTRDGRKSFWHPEYKEKLYPPELYLPDHKKQITKELWNYIELNICTPIWCCGKIDCRICQKSKFFNDDGFVGINKTIYKKLLDN